MEVLSRTDSGANDAIELRNPRATPWIQRLVVERRFQHTEEVPHPGRTMISAGGFVVFTEADFNPAAPVSRSVPMVTRSGCFSADPGGNLTGYVHGHTFGAATTP